MPVIQRLNEPTYHQRVTKVLKPLEERWDYIQGVLLWKKPTHSLCYIIAVNAFFSLISTGWFRVYLIGSIVVASSLLVEDVRVQVWQALEQGGISHENEDESSASVLAFSGVCEKVASVWELAIKGYTKLYNIKAQSMKKFYGIAFCIILILVYAYQYLPIIQILYITICVLFFQPAVKYYGVGKVVQKGLEPFYKPFMVQWQNNRTKRQRNKVLKEVSGTDDSDEEFTRKLNPAEMTALQPHLLTDEGSDRETNERQEDHQEEVISPPPDTAFQDDENTPEEPDTISSVDTQSLGDEISGSASLENTASFIEGLDRLPSTRTSNDSFEENDFMEGLEFPDISGEQYHSSNESLNLIDGKRSHTNAPPATETDVQRQPALLTSSSQQSSLDVSDFEVLDRSEAEGMTTRNEHGNPQGTASAVSEYVGKWLGY